MHSVALTSDSSCGNQIRAERIVLWQICGEVHLLPLELFPQLFFSREPKLSQMPSLDEVDLPISRQCVDLIWMLLIASEDLIWVSLTIRFVVAQEEGVLFTR